MRETALSLIRIRLKASCSKRLGYPATSSNWIRSFSSTCFRSSSDPALEQDEVKTSPFHAVSFDDHKLWVPWEEGKTSAYHHIWLRDSCKCKECMHEVTKQRMVKTFDLPKSIKPMEAIPNKEGLRIKWSNGGHESEYNWNWLYRHSYQPKLQDPIYIKKQLWGSEISKDLPTVAYDEVMSSDGGIAKFTRNIAERGFTFVEGVPPSAEDTETLLRRIAPPQITHYGGFWVFEPDLSQADTAYTNIALPAHNDTCYFLQSCGLQSFHCLENTDPNGGGKSLLVDGFKAAKKLRNEYPDAWRILTRVPFGYHASGHAGENFVARGPILNYDNAGRIVQVRWNNDDRMVLDETTQTDSMDQIYEAMNKWMEIITSPEIELWESLTPGRVVVFDNWRVLHGRSAFEGRRKMCGAYIGMDAFLSRMRTTNYSQETLDQEI